MADSNRLVSLIILLVAGLLIAIWGALNIWFKYRDGKVLDQLVNDGSLTAADRAKLSNPILGYGLAAVQILIGIGLIIYGIVQYTVKQSIVSEVKDLGQKALNTARSLGDNATRRIAALSRRRPVVAQAEVYDLME